MSKRLTFTKAIQEAQEFWTELAKTGKTKHGLILLNPAFYHFNGYNYYCPLCEYNDCEYNCNRCPFLKQFGTRCFDKDLWGYNEWEDAQTAKTRKKYAAIFLGYLMKLEVPKFARDSKGRFIGNKKSEVK